MYQKLLMVRYCTGNIIKMKAVVLTAVTRETSGFI
jgi:hypothetical protein